MNAVSFVSLLESLGFEERPGGAYVWNFGNMELSLVECVSLRMVPGLLASGVYATERTVTVIDQFLPQTVVSYEEGLALLAYVCRDTKPQIIPDWLRNGQEGQDQLPWRRESAETAQRPKCVIELDWFKLMLRDLSAKLKAEGNAILQFRFDGKILQISDGSNVVACPANGAAWDKDYHLPASSLANLPKRFRAEFSIEVWQGMLCIANRRFHLVDPQNKVHSE